MYEREYYLRDDLVRASAALSFNEERHASGVEDRSIQIKRCRERVAYLEGELEKYNK